MLNYMIITKRELKKMLNEDIQKVIKNLDKNFYYRNAKNIYIDNEFIYIDGEKAFELMDGYVQEYFDI